MSLNDGIDQWNCYPLHTKRAFPFNLSLRIQRICSSSETFKLRCNELTQGQYLNRHGSGLLKQNIQRVHTFTHTHTSNSPTHIPLVAGYHPAIQSISFFFSPSRNKFTFSHPRNFVLLCLNIYLSLPSYVLTRRKSAKWISRWEP